MEGRRVARWFAPSIGDVLFLSIFFWTLFNGVQLLNDGDTNWHIVTGRNIIAGMGIPHADPYSHTMPGTPWTSHEWLAAVVFAFWFLMYLLNAILGPPELNKVFYGFAATYGLAFFALVAGYFWARWYAVGVGLFGLILGAVGLWQVGPDEQILFIGGTHLLAVLCLWGSAMAEGYDGQTAWREKLHMDEHAVRLHVCDDGPGVPPDLRDRLFQPFASRSPEGTGLGLAIVARVAQAHGGHAALTERAPWRTCFTLELPRQTPP